MKKGKKSVNDFKEPDDSGKNKEDRYSDLYDLPHHVSKVHPQMSAENRAAQFSPFAALVDYEGVINETGRLTEEQSLLTEDEMSDINRTLSDLLSLPLEKREAEIVYFVPDDKKNGGAYISVTGKILRAEPVRGVLIMEDKTEIQTERILSVNISENE